MFCKGENKYYKLQFLGYILFELISIKESFICYNYVVSVSENVIYNMV